MFATSPFAKLSVFISPGIMQTYVAVMILLVVGGTLFDVSHKKSARYFSDLWRNAKSEGTRRVGGGEMALLAIHAVAVDGLTSGEFCNARRRVAHLLTMYGFLAYVVTTVIMVFLYPTPATPAPAVVPALWYIGGLLVCLGGYWFWFFIRVDVSAEGNSPFRLVQADLFVISLLASVTLGLVWACIQSAGDTIWADMLLAAYLLATTVLFGSIPWSKFSHMFFKPAAAFQKRVEQANGSRRNLPAPSTNPVRLGSSRQLPRNY